MFHDLGYDLFSIGSYVNPHNPHDPKRPALPQIPRKPELESCLRGNDREDLPQELIDWCDTVIYAGLPDQWMIPNWHRLKWAGKRIIWRTIGQSNLKLEGLMSEFHRQGLQIVRYSPAERRFFEQNGVFAGQDALIRFGKYPEDWGGWTGESGMVGQVSQHTDEPHGRDLFTNWRWFESATQGLPTTFAGSHSELIGGLGELDYDAMRAYLRGMGAYCYTGTVPASYTLGLIEAMMTGVPTVSISKDHMWSGPELFEADEIALLSYKDPRQANQMLREILEDTGFANTLSGMTRERAIALFSAERIKDQWREFLGE
jgi:hypothetical protein